MGPQRISGPRSREQVRRSHRIAFEDLVKEARERLEEPARGEFAGETEKVQTWLESQAPAGKGLAVFSCTAGSGERSSSPCASPTT